MRVVIKDLRAQHAEIRAEVERAVAGVFESGHYILGPQVSQFESAMADYCGVEHAVGVSSGTDALLVALMALGVAPGDLVATSTFSFFATAGVIARLGAKPVFVDIDPETYNMDPRHLRKRLETLSTEDQGRVRAIIPVHLFGQCAEIAAIQEVAVEYGLPIIEDAAQAVGAQYADGRKAGALGLAGCLSFFPTKNLGAAGDAGMVLTRDADLATRLRTLRVHGSQPKYFHSLVGGNFRLDTIQAAVLLVKIRHLDDWARRCQEKADRYAALFAADGLSSQVKLPMLRYRQAGVSGYHVFHQYVISVEKRDALKKFLQEMGVGTEIYYPLPLHLQECFRALGYRQGDFPQAEKASTNLLALPMYPQLSEDQQAYVVQCIHRFYRSNGANHA